MAQVPERILSWLYSHLHVRLRYSFDSRRSASGLTAFRNITTPNEHTPMPHEFCPPTLRSPNPRPTYIRTRMAHSHYS